MDKCANHDEFVKETGAISNTVALMAKDLEYIRRDQETILARFLAHVENADKDGGWHDRIRLLETDTRGLETSLATFRKFQLLYSAIGGIVGGVVGSQSPELFVWVVELIAK